MKKLIQTKLHDPPAVIGNCFATVVACFLDTDIDKVPPVEDIMQEDHWVSVMTGFLNAHGWEWDSLDGHLENNEYYIVVGQSDRGNPHCCIYLNGELYHDPHPDQTGLITETHFEYLRNLKATKVAENFKLFVYQKRFLSKRNCWARCNDCRHPWHQLDTKYVHMYQLTPPHEGAAVRFICDSCMAIRNASHVAE